MSVGVGVSLEVFGTSRLSVCTIKSRGNWSGEWFCHILRVSCYCAAHIDTRQQLQLRARYSAGKETGNKEAVEQAESEAEWDK